MKKFCYWTVADGEYAEMAKVAVRSARSVGIDTDFHIWSDREIPNAVTYPAGNFEKWGWYFKLTFLRDAVQNLDYEYFIWIDTDTYFVRHPGDILRVMNGSPLHIFLECDVQSPKNRRT